MTRLNFSPQLCLILSVISFVGIAQAGVRVGVFNVDATPDVGSPLAYDPMTWKDKPLSARGIIWMEEGDLPIVSCVVDWIGIANGGQDSWKAALAEAAGTLTDRVVVHTLHQHDAPVCDFTANELLVPHGLNGVLFDPVFARDTIQRAAHGVREAMGHLIPVTHVGFGQAEVKEVASNRRILGPDGKVKVTRYTATKDPEVRAYPAGTIDPVLRMVSFWNDDEPIVAMSFYATHPQSYYRTGGANPDFPGMAREFWETAQRGVPLIHFNGAGGNIGAGKYNDGSQEMRLVLATRLARGMSEAWNTTEKFELGQGSLSWKTVPLPLPVAPHLEEARLRAVMADGALPELARKNAAADLAWWMRRTVEERVNQIGCLGLGPVRVLFCPGEMVVEYQLAAQQMVGGGKVCLAAYGDYGPGYICLTEHYAQGGYESSPQASRVAAEVESVMIPALRQALE